MSPQENEERTTRLNSRTISRGHYLIIHHEKEFRVVVYRIKNHRTPHQCNCTWGAMPHASGQPHETGFFIGLAQAPLKFQNMVAELVDNSIAAANDSPFKVTVNLEEVVTGQWKVTVLDHSGGINLQSLMDGVFRTGQPPENENQLNEHGYGLKNVLAKTEAVSKNNNSWRVVTSPSEGEMYSISGPLRMQMEIDDQINKNELPEAFPDSGFTAVEVSLPVSYLGTVADGKRGGNPTQISTIDKFLREHLGVYYCEYLRQIGDNEPSQNNLYTSINWQKRQVGAVIPEFEHSKIIPRTRVESLTSTYIHGKIGSLSREFYENQNYYYTNNQYSQGVDIVIRHGDEPGRIIATTLLKEIWGVERHNSYNKVAGRIFVECGVRSERVRTLNNKTSLSFDDPIWLAIREAITDKFPSDKLPQSGSEKLSEEELTLQLERSLISHYGSEGFKITSQDPVFHRQFIRADLTVQKENDWRVYECKAGKATPISAYQLRMYWDGICDSHETDEISPTKGVLVCGEVSPHTQRLIDYLNKQHDQHGNFYKFEIKTWSDFNIKDTNVSK